MDAFRASRFVSDAISSIRREFLTFFRSSGLFLQSGKQWWKHYRSSVHFPLTLPHMVFHITGIFAQCLCTLIDILCCRSYFILPTLDIRNGFMHLSDCFCLMGWRLQCLQWHLQSARSLCVRNRSCPSTGASASVTLLGYGHTVFCDAVKFFHGFIKISDHCTKFVLPVYHVTVNRTGEFRRNIFKFSTDDIQYFTRRLATK